MSNQVDEGLHVCPAPCPIFIAIPGLKCLRCQGAARHLHLSEVAAIV